ncbi:amino acid ABC transporter permease [Paracoccus sp. (in: a-proteobacteria)]|uniref:amino acid ABC transporter permease n=1 Tax=Paracoccus sp. TaxID=267 RepID=UPI0026E0628F|nr:amino acid ABC transporter permease [Paracoccus sp. (in: a-proteobacteria)]MDO5369355.1 amino acid ABC transporter permease [Paracoccus sp. (in: a-proteobacteria)]
MARKTPVPMAPVRGVLPVLLPFSPRGPAYDDFFMLRWLASIPAAWLLAAAALFPLAVMAQSGRDAASAFEAVIRWAPFLFTQGFLFNVLISVLAMALGTAVGALAGLGLISRNRLLRGIVQAYVTFFRNVPWLVLLFIILLGLPFQVQAFGMTIPLPGWIKVVIGLALPVSANIAEVVRGAIQSVPTAQWEGAESLGFTRRQTIWQIILPQCVKRMLPPWMNWYAIMTMSTPLASLLGVNEVISLTRQAMEAEGNYPELLMPFYGFALLLFLAYCYPIARLTMRLERRFAVKT